MRSRFLLTLVVLAACGGPALPEGPPHECVTDLACTCQPHLETPTHVVQGAPYVDRFTFCHDGGELDALASATCDDRWRSTSSGRIGCTCWGCL
jgi:hypothetical protein